MTIGLVLVSHSAKLADGLLDVARQMAADVPITPAGGTDDGRIGTSFDRVEQAIAAQLESGAEGVVILTDLGSATLTAESVLELLDDPRVVLVDVPFVEGTVAAAVAAQGGAGLDAVAAAARSATSSVGVDAATPASTGSPTAGSPTAVSPPAVTPTVGSSQTCEPAGGPTVTRTVTIRNRLGLHARPAAAIAQLAEQFDADVTINGADARSVLEVMSLGLTAGDTVAIAAGGPQADEATGAVAIAIEGGFGET